MGVLCGIVFRMNKTKIFGNAEANRIKSKQKLSENLLQITNKGYQEYLTLVQKVAPAKTRLFVKAFLGKSPGSAIKAKCTSCVNLEDVQTRIKECSCHNCPLHPYRPYK